MVASVPLVNNGVAITAPAQFVDKAYVDAQITGNSPAAIVTGNTSVTTSASSVITEVNNL